MIWKFFSQKKSYEIQMNLYNAQFYYDKEDIYALWRPDFLYEYLEEDMIEQSRFF